MNLVPFILIGCSEQNEEQFVCREQLGEAMPLFKIPVSDRISTYEYILNNSFLQAEKILRGNTIEDSRFEYQYILQLNSITDVSLINEYRTIYALSSGELKFYNARKLTNEGWDIAAMFGSRPAEAFELQSFQINWPSYYPGYLPLNIRFFYFNFLTSEKENYIKALINCHVKEEEAKKVCGEPLPLNWQDQYYASFIDQTAGINVNAGDILGKADHHIDGNTDNVYRLSMHYLQREFSADYSHNLTDFMRFRGRVPTIAKKDKTDLGSIAGHPIIKLQTSLPVSVSRVDFIDQTTFSTKSTKPLAIDLDKNPVNLVIRRAPSVEQVNILQGLNINIDEITSNKLTIYNPDGQYLKVVIVAPTNSSLQLISPKISNQELVKTINIVISSPTITTARLQVVLTDPSFQLDIAIIYEIDLTFLDCKLVPVSFWSLHDTLHNYKPDSFDIHAVLTSTNRILGEQCNTYLYWENPQATIPEIQVLGPVTKSLDTSIVLENVLTFLKNNTSQKCNVIWTWDLDPATSSDEAGETLPVISNQNIFLFPIIFVESTRNFSDDDRGIILAHEFCHFLIHYGLHYNDLTDTVHFDDDPLSGDDSFAYNLMQSSFSKENFSLTTAQRLILNQHADLNGSAPLTPTP